jgi:uncharacterized protein YecE (DUF72 family)
MIKLGTSGFSYDDWIGPVYPQDLPRWKWLPFYAEQFNTVELNVTYYRLPSIAALPMIAKSRISRLIVRAWPR